MPIPIGRKRSQLTALEASQPTSRSALTAAQVAAMKPQSSLPVGSVIATGALTPTEKQVLAQMGWKSGDPVPAGISQELAGLQVVQDIRQVQEKLREEAKNALLLPPDTPPLEMPTPTLLKDMPKEQQREILARMQSTIANTKDLVRAAEEEARNPKQRPQFQDPSLEQAIHSIMEQTGLDPTKMQVSSPTVKPVEPVVPVDPLAHPASYLSEREQQKRAERLQASVRFDSSTDSGAKKSDTGVLKEHASCPHCGWDQSKPEPAEQPSYEDKTGFLQSVLGQIRYKKVYALFEGKMAVVFRTLTAEEADLCMTQTALDMAKTGQFGNEKVFWRTLADYRLVLSVESVYSEGKGKIYTAPEDIWTGFDIAPEDKPKDSTILPLVVNYMYAEVLTMETLRKMIGVNFFLFQRMVELMEAHVLDANFWKATEEQP